MSSLVRNSIKKSTGRLIGGPLGDKESRGWSPTAREESESGLRLAELGLLTRIRNYCDHNETDGLMPKNVLDVIGRDHPRSIHEAMAGLIVAGFIRAEATGFRDVYFDTWAQTTAEREVKRTKERLKKRRQRAQGDGEMGSNSDLNPGGFRSNPDLNPPTYGQSPQGTTTSTAPAASSQPIDVPRGHSQMSPGAPNKTSPTDIEKEEGAIAEKVHPIKAERRRNLIKRVVSFCEEGQGRRQTKAAIAGYLKIQADELHEVLRDAIRCGDLKYVPDNVYEASEMYGETVGSILATHG